MNCLSQNGKSDIPIPKTRDWLSILLIVTKHSRSRHPPQDIIQNHLNKVFGKQNLLDIVSFSKLVVDPAPRPGIEGRRNLAGGKLL